MIRRNHAFLTAQRGHSRPVVLVFLTSTQTRRVYGAKIPPDEIGGGMETWDSTYTVGDGGTFGSEIGTSDTQARVLRFGSVRQNLVRNTKDILTSLSQAEIPVNALVLDNADGYFSRMLSAAYGESFINQTLEIKIGFSGLASSDYLSLTRGIVTQEKLSNKELTLEYVGLTSSVFETWELPKTSRYANPRESNGVLPVVLGDLTENTGSQGVYVCPCIDTVNSVYALACHALLPVASGNVITLYDGDGDEITSGVTLTTSGDYESQGVIAYATFTSAPKEPVKCKCSGAINDSGALITNPIDAIEYLFDLAGDTTTFQATAKAIARIHADSENYLCAGVLQADNALAYWLTTIMSAFLGSWYINYRDEIVLSYIRDTTQRFNLDGVLVERNYLNTPTATRTHATLCNQPIYDYAYSADRSDKRFKNDASTYFLQTDDGSDYIDADSLRLYGERKVSMSTNFCRHTANINTFQEYIVDTFSRPVWELPIAEQGFDNLHVEIGETLLFSWSDLYDENNQPLVNQIGWVLQKAIDLDNMTITWQILDTGDYYPTHPDTWDGSCTVGDGRTFGGDRQREDLS